MSLELKNVEIHVRGRLKPLVFQNIDFRVERGERVALLCPDPAGLSGLIRLISSGQPPEKGMVTRDSRISWPIPDLGLFHRHLNFIANARFFARLYEVDEKSFIEQVIEKVDLGAIAEERLDRCPKAATSRFAFGLGACLPFDIYLFTNTNIGEKNEREKYEEMIANLGERSGLILAGGNPKAAQALCERAFLIDGRTTHCYDDMDSALEHLRRLTKGQEAGEGEEEDASSMDDDDRMFGDF